VAMLMAPRIGWKQYFVIGLAFSLLVEREYVTAQPSKAQWYRGETISRCLCYIKWELQTSVVYEGVSRDLSFFLFYNIFISIY
jgi:hypothetical protein